MENPAIPAATVSVFTRHAPGCPKKADRTWKKCKCRKALYIYEAGHDRIISAKTRSWEQAEQLARQERDMRDPARQKLREIEQREASKIEAEKAAVELAEKRAAEKIAFEKGKNITLAAACDRWVAAQTFKSKETAFIYGRAARRIQSWAADI
jgi:hypothetical protein